MYYLVNLLQIDFYSFWRNRSQTLPVKDKQPQQTQACEIEDKGDAATANPECGTAVTQIMEETDDLYEDANDPGKFILDYII